MPCRPRRVYRIEVAGIPPQAHGPVSTARLPVPLTLPFLPQQRLRAGEQLPEDEATVTLVYRARERRTDQQGVHGVARPYRKGKLR